MGFNYLKEWKATIGGMAIVQKAEPHDGGDTLLVITGMRGPGTLDYHNTSSTIPFADAEKLADDAFRMEIARRDLAERVLRLRAVVDFAAAALAADHEDAVRWHVHRDERNGRHTP